MNGRVKTVLDSILERFQTGDIPEAIAYSMFPFPDVPSSKSIMGTCNQMPQEKLDLTTVEYDICI